MVSLRARKPRVYDSEHGCTPRGRSFCDLADDAPLDREIADDTLRSLGPTRLELRLHEHERLPAARSERERGRKRKPDRDERDVAGHELWRERQPRQLARIRLLDHGHPGIVADLRVQLPVADVERDHARGPALKE